jgi:hypothetical protein
MGGCYYDIITAVYSKTVLEKLRSIHLMKCWRTLPVGVMERRKGGMLSAFG